MFVASCPPSTHVLRHNHLRVLLLRLCLAMRRLVVCRLRVPLRVPLRVLLRVPLPLLRLSSLLRVALMGIMISPGRRFMYVLLLVLMGICPVRVIATRRHFMHVLLLVLVFIRIRTVRRAGRRI